MSRSGYSEDCDNLGLYRATVARAINGKRGQSFLREMAAALDAMLVKELITHEIVSDDSKVCAIGSVALARRLDIAKLDVDEPDDVAVQFNIARALAAEIAYENDECGIDYRDGKYEPETPAERWTRMRKWVDEQIIKL